MSFIDDIKNCLAGELPASPTFRAVLFGDHAVYFECVTEIRSYSQNEIFLCLKRGGLIVKGENLYLKNYCKGDVAVCGKIKSVEMV